MQFSIEETKWAGKAGYHYEVLDSTNKKAKELNIPIITEEELLMMIKK
jgi:hypothetical protein